jgi:hypothetical protein
MDKEQDKLTHSLPTFWLAFGIADLLEPECKMNCTAKGIRIEGKKAGQGYVIEIEVVVNPTADRRATAQEKTHE